MAESALAQHHSVTPDGHVNGDTSPSRAWQPQIVAQDYPESAAPADFGKFSDCETAPQCDPTRR
jgi:hypothetical protein